MDPAIIARFERRIDRNGPIARPGLTPCHLWLGALNAQGYGVCWDGARTQLAHRMAWFVKHGRWPNACALHTCDNPPCCNADHLFEGTRTTNLADMRSKGRGAPTPHTYGSAHPNARLSEDAVVTIRERKGATQELAQRFGVSRTTIKNVRRRKTRTRG